MKQYELTNEMITRYKNNYDGNRSLKALSLALSSASLGDAAFDEIASGSAPFKFSIDIPTMPVTNQKSSGRCWLFASLNLFREIVGKKLNLENFELSENYIAFWDKFEKINYFLQSVVDTAELDIDDRLVNHIMANGISDGGQWNMMVSLVKKYGLVPKDAMPETHQSSNTGVMNRMLMMKLREYAMELRTMVQEGCDTEMRRDEMMEEMFNALCICFGRPPETFDFEYVDKDKEYHVVRGLTPKTFFDDYVAFPFDDYVSIINSPTKDKPYLQTYIVTYVGSVVGGEPIFHLNVDMETMKELIIAQLKDNELVWFGSDVAKYGHRTLGLWDSNAFGYDLLLNMSFDLTKEQGLDTRDSAMNHAMVISGVNFDENGTADRWKIENSWGDERAHKGYYIMGAQWFDQYVYQAVINKKYLNAELQEALKTEPILLHPWDPMGTLAD